MTTLSSILAWIIPWTEKTTVHGVAKELGTTERLSRQAGICRI